MKTHFRAAAVLLACAVGSVGCKKDSSEPPPPTDGATRVFTGPAWQVDGAVEPALTDGDTTTGVALDGRKVIELALIRPTALAGIRLYVTGPVSFQIKGDPAIGSGDAVAGELTSLGWHTIPLPGVHAGKLRVSIAPKETLLRFMEIEAWAAGRNPLWADLDTLRAQESASTLTIKPIPDHGRLVPAGSGDGDSNGATCLTAMVDVSVPVAQIGRAHLTYQARGVAGTHTLTVSINGRGDTTGTLLPVSQELRAYQQRILPGLLALGPNQLRICGPAVGAHAAQLQDLALHIEAVRGGVLEDDVNAAQRALLDGNDSTEIAGTGVIELALRRPSNIVAITLRHGPDFNARAVQIRVDGVDVRVAEHLQLVGGTVAIFETAPTGSRISLDLGQAGAPLRDIEVQASGVGTAWPIPMLVVDHPQRGMHWNGTGIITGFVEGLVSSDPPVVIAEGTDLVAPAETLSSRGVFTLTVSQIETEGSFSATVSARPNGIELRRRVVFATDGSRTGGNGNNNNGANNETPEDWANFGREGDVARGTVTSNGGGEIRLGQDVAVIVQPGSVTADTEISVRRPARSSLARLNPGMINVTAPNRAGYQFLPHGAHFNIPVAVHLPYDPRLLPTGMTPLDVRTYYFDGGQYVPLERAQVDVEQQIIVSLTDHFTDMINAVLVQPESPSPEGFNPNSVSGIAVANPTSGMTLIAPPTPNKDGTANIQYPFILPKARGRYQPQMSLSYSSEGGWGQAGEGWNLSTSAIEVDTRFGAARYERGLPPELPLPNGTTLNPHELLGSIGIQVPSTLAVGERYLLDGQAIVPTARTGPCHAGTGSGTVFVLRKEGRFARIVRCGDTPAEYHWEVTERDGTRMVYGYDDDSRVRAPHLIPARRNIGKWLLDHVVDVDGNGCLYEYNEGSRIPLPNENQPGVSRRLTNIKYTFDPGATFWNQNAPAAPHYEIEIGYEDRLNRLSDGTIDPLSTVDERIDGRMGFAFKSARRANSVAVKCRGDACTNTDGTPSPSGDVIRHYELSYSGPNVGTQHKSLLKRIRSCGAGNGCSLPHDTSFEYEAPDYRMGEPGVNSATPGQAWTLPEGSLPALSLGLNVSGGASAGGSVAPGFAVDAVKGLTVGASVSGSLSLGGTVMQFMDLNGDGLPDQVISGAGIDPAQFAGWPLGVPPPNLAVHFNTGHSGGNAIERVSFAGAPQPSTSAPALTRDPNLVGPVAVPPLGTDMSLSESIGANANARIDAIGVGAHLGGNGSLGASVAFPADVNGDGLTDFVAGPINLVQTRLPAPDQAGKEIIAFLPDALANSNQTCPGVSASLPAVPNPPPLNVNPTEGFREVQEAMGKRDQVLKWRAPRSGEVHINIMATKYASCLQAGGEPPHLEVFLVSGPVRPRPEGLLQDLKQRVPQPWADVEAIYTNNALLKQVIDDLFESGSTVGDWYHAILPLKNPTVMTLPQTFTFATSDLARVGDDESFPSIHIERGAELFVRVAAGTSCASEEAAGLLDVVDLDVSVDYTDNPGPDPTGQSQQSYNSQRDFRVMGAQGPLVVPYLGSAEVKGNVRVVHAQPDDVTVRLLKITCNLPNPANLIGRSPGDQAEDSYFPTQPVSVSRINDLALPTGFGDELRRLRDVCSATSDVLKVITAGQTGVINIEKSSFPVSPGMLLAITIDGRTLIDPGAIVVHSVDNGTGPARFELRYDGGDPAKRLSITELASGALEPVPDVVLEVPVATGHRRLVPSSGRYVTVALNQQGSIKLDALAIPNSWTGGSGAHLLVQRTDGSVVRRAPFQRTCPMVQLPGNFCPFDCGTCTPGCTTCSSHCTCPDVQCVNPACWSLSCQQTCQNCNLVNSPLRVPLTCAPPGCSGCGGLPDCIGDDVCGAIADQLFADAPIAFGTVEIADVPAGTYFVSLEPPESALFALMPEPWDLIGIANKVLGAPFMSGTVPHPGQIAEWGLGQTLMFNHYARTLSLHLSVGGSAADTDEFLNMLVPDGTFGLPLPFPIYSTVGAATAEGWHGWSYGQFVPAPHGPDVPVTDDGIDDTLYEEFTHLTDANPTNLIRSLGSVAQLDISAEVAAFAQATSAEARLARLRNGAGLLGGKTTAIQDFLKETQTVQTALIREVLNPLSFIPQVFPLRPVPNPAAPRYEGICPESANTGILVYPTRCIPQLPLPTSLGITGDAPDIKARMLRLAACPVGVPRATQGLGLSTGANVFAFGGTLGVNGSQTLSEYRDMTGDGIPDLVFSIPPPGLPVGPMVVLRANRRPSVVPPYMPGFMGMAPINTTVNAQVGANVDFKELASKAPGVLAKAAQVAEAFIGTPAPSAEVGVSLQASTLNDINGDSLPDLVLGVTCTSTTSGGGILVQLNLGGYFEVPRCWQTQNVNLAEFGLASPAIPMGATGYDSLSLGASFEGGVQMSGGTAFFARLNGAHGSASLARHEQLMEFHDVNGDGLLDRVLMFNDQQVWVWLNTGLGFTALPIRWDAAGWTAVLSKLALERGISLDGLAGLLRRLPDGQMVMDVPFVNKRFTAGKQASALTAQVGRSSLTLDPSSSCGAGFEPKCVGRTVFDAMTSNAFLPSSLESSQTVTIGGGGGVSGSTEVDVQIGPVPILIGLTGNIGANIGGSITFSTTTFVDINGDGLPEPIRAVLLPDGTSTIVVMPNMAAKANLLRAVVNPLGGRIELDYTRLGNTFEMPQSRWVLTDIRTKNGTNNGTNAVGEPTGTVEGGIHHSARYEGGRFDRLNKEFLGFREVVTTERDLVSGEQLRRRIETYHNDNYYMAGMLQRRIVAQVRFVPPRQEVLEELDRTELNYHEILVEPGVLDESACPRPAPLPPDTACRAVAVLPKRTEQISNEGSSRSEHTATTILEYDEYGNPTLQVDEGDVPDDPSNMDNIVVGISYRPTTADIYLPSLPTQVLVNDGHTGRLLRVRQGAYDARGHLTQWTAQSEYRRPDGTFVDSTILTSRYGLDAFGNVVEHTLPTGNVISAAYDSTNTFVVALSDRLDQYHLEDFDRRFGVSTKSVDSNGNAIVTQYDARARMEQVGAPGDADGSTIVVTYGCFGTLRCALTAQDVPGHPLGLKTYAVVDALGVGVFNAKTVVKDGFPGVAVNSRHRTDGLGHQRLSGLSEFVPDAEVSTMFDDFADLVTDPPRPPKPLHHPSQATFDLKDRPTELVVPGDGADDFLRTKVTYSAVTENGADRLLVTTLDPNNQQSEIIKDDERVYQYVEYPDGPGGQALRTRYSFNQLDEVISIRDADQNETRFEYDGLGRRRFQFIPDTGDTYFFYDDAGRLERKVDARGRFVRNVYEPLSTRVEHIARGMPSAPETTFDFEYGRADAGFNRNGRVTRSVDEDGTNNFKYDALGNVTEVRRTLSDGREYTTNYLWDDFSRAMSITFPETPSGRETVIYHYDTAGQVTSASGYVDDIQYDEFGQRTLIRHSNGLTQAYKFKERSRRLDLLTAAVVQGDLFRQQYSYDPVGNILEMTGTISSNPRPTIVPNSVTRRYGYDKLHRLTTASMELVYVDGTMDTSSSFTFSNIHNISAKDQRARGTDGSSIDGQRQLFTFGYEAPHPHRLRRIVNEAALPEAETYSFDYDAAGNQISSDDFRGHRSMTWSADGMMKTLTLNGAVIAFGYDAEGNRVSKGIVGGTPVHFLGPHATVSGSLLHKHVFVGDTRVATTVEAPGMTKFGVSYATDHLGTTNALVDQNGSPIEVVFNHPNGAPFEERRAGDIPQTQFLYQGHSYDNETGLHWFQSQTWEKGGGRYWDSETTQWKSFDPAWEKQLQIGLSGYSGMALNPLRFEDPDGRGWGKAAVKTAKKALQKKMFDYARQKGVRKAWREEYKRVFELGLEPTAEFTQKELKFLKKHKGKKGIPGWEGHHINSVKDNDLAMAANPDNIKFVKGRKAHLEEHGNDFANETSGPLMKRLEGLSGGALVVFFERYEGLLQGQLKENPLLSDPDSVWSWINPWNAIVENAMMTQALGAAHREHKRNQEEEKEEEVSAEDLKDLQ